MTGVPVEILLSLMPMHLLLAEDGAILSCGPTLRKIVGNIQNVKDGFTLRRAAQPQSLMFAIQRAAEIGQRIFLSPTGSSAPPLRAEAARLPGGKVLLNAGFGIGVVDAISRYNLTDADFAANELAVEIMYLHMANLTIRDELSRHSIQLEQARQAAQQQAHTDPLTGLLNRRGFDAAFHRAVEMHQAATAGCCEFGLMQLDLDWFKEVNDRHGHAAGDNVLKHVAEILRRNTRLTDSVARIGGDEFLVLMPGMVSPPRLSQLAQRIIQAIQTPMTVGGATCRISASIGAVLSETYDNLTVDAMLADVDEALYTAKKAGRGCLHLANSATVLA